MKTTKPIAYGIVGSRTFNDYEYMKSVLKWYNIRKIVSGGAKGADKLAERYALEYDIPNQVFEADWNRHGKAAGPIRNKQIIEACEELIAFHDGKSKGTMHSIKFAKQNNKPVYIYWPEPDELEGLGL